MILYRTFAKIGTASYTVERSRFLAHASPVSSRQEAEAFMEKKRREYHDATHNVPAMVVGDKMQIQWASDDGEPQGTAGAPLVQLLVGEGITNAVLVITRYFGGIKLGTGGLVRAYTAAAKAVIEEVGIREAREMLRVEAELGYDCYDSAERCLLEEGFAIEDRRFAESVGLLISAEKEKREGLEALLRGCSRGAVRFGKWEEYVG